MKNLLPKWLIADDGAERDFVIHCHRPKFIMELNSNEWRMTLIDSSAGFFASELERGRDPMMTIDRLIMDAREFLASQADQ